MKSTPSGLEELISREKKSDLLLSRNGDEGSRPPFKACHCDISVTFGNLLQLPREMLQVKMIDKDMSERLTSSSVREGSSRVY